MVKREPTLEAEIDTLFQGPLGEFTAARNALAKRLSKEGRALDADRVKALAKPPAPAWAVNQLYWQDPNSIGLLLAAGERVRKAQFGQRGNANLRELLAEKKQIMTALTEKAAAILGASGNGASPDAMRRVSATLESLAVWGDTAGVPRAGRLTSDLDPPGFDALAALIDAKKLGPARVLPFQRPKPAEDRAAARAQAREAVHAAEKALREARREAERAEAALTKATAHTAAVEKQKQEIEARLMKAKEEMQAASNEARKAAQTVADAERALAKARAGTAGSV
jgi:hypothetical protein